MNCACYIAEGDGPLRLNPCPEHERWAKAIRDYEREACASVAAEPPALGGPNHGAWDRGYLDGRRAAAAAIRNRSN